MLDAALMISYVNFVIGFHNLSPIMDLGHTLVFKLTTTGVRSPSSFDSLFALCYRSIDN